MPPHDEWRRIICTWVRNQRNFRKEPIRPCCRSGPWSGHQLSVYQQSGSIQFVRISTSWLVFSCAAEITKFFRHLYIAKKGCESVQPCEEWKIGQQTCKFQALSIIHSKVMCFRENKQILRNLSGEDAFCNRRNFRTEHVEFEIIPGLKTNLLLSKSSH